MSEKLDSLKIAFEYWQKSQTEPARYSTAAYWNFLDAIQPFCVSLIDGRPQAMLGCFTIFSDGLQGFLNAEFPKYPKEFWQFQAAALGNENNERMLKLELNLRVNPTSIDSDFAKNRVKNLTEAETIELYLSELKNPHPEMIEIVSEVARQHFKMYSEKA